jgi:hypothetical protein
MGPVGIEPTLYGLKVRCQTTRRRSREADGENRTPSAFQRQITNLVRYHYGTSAFKYPYGTSAFKKIKIRQVGFEPTVYRL